MQDLLQKVLYIYQSICSQLRCIYRFTKGMETYRALPNYLLKVEEIDPKASANKVRGTALIALGFAQHCLKLPLLGTDHSNCYVILE